MDTAVSANILAGNQRERFSVIGNPKRLNQAMRELLGTNRLAQWCTTKIMQLARVIGTVVATQKYEGLAGIKFLVVQPLRKTQEPIGDPVVAADATAQAGPDDLVFIVGSREAAQAMPIPFVPVDHAIVGIVDDVQLA